MHCLTYKNQKKKARVPKCKIVNWRARCWSGSSWLSAVELDFPTPLLGLKISFGLDETWDFCFSLAAAHWAAIDLYSDWSPRCAIYMQNLLLYNDLQSWGGKTGQLFQ